MLEAVPSLSEGIKKMVMADSSYSGMGANDKGKMMDGKTPNPRNPECEIDSMFTDRWSPRAFLPEPLPEHQIKTLFEAATDRF